MFTECVLVVQAKQQLKQISQSRYRNWTDTLEALRERKLQVHHLICWHALCLLLTRHVLAQERKLRLDAIENAQKKVDEQEAIVQTQIRKSTIDRAQRLLFENSATAREFQSSILLSQVIKEREVCGLALAKDMCCCHHFRFLATVRMLMCNAANG